MSAQLITPVRLRGITCRFGRQGVLHGVDLDVSRGEIVAVLGANGAGKTTLFSILVGLVQPDAGERTFAGASVSEVTHEVRAQLAWVAHSPQLYALLTARENLELFADLWGTAGVRSEDAARMLVRLGLEESIDRSVGTFSRGMAQRVVLARALAQKPELLVLDEPFTALDRAGRHLLCGLLLEARDEGAAVLLSSHDIDQVAVVADRVLLLEGGVIAGTVLREGRDEGRDDPDFRERIGRLLGGVPEWAGKAAESRT